MKWNIFKRVVELEQSVKDLTDFNFDNSRWIKRVDERAQNLENANQNLVNSNQALIGRHENIGKRLENLEHQVYIQSRQQDPQIAAFEKAIADLNHELVTQGQVMTMLHNQIRAHHHAAATDPRLPVFVTDEVDQEREKKRQYQREWYAKKRSKLQQEKNVKVAREKRNAYQRAYYARKKGENK